MREVRINGQSTERIKKDGREYAQWIVEVLNSDGEWQMVTTCYGPASASSAVLIAEAWANDKIPSPVDIMVWQKPDSMEAQ